MIFTVRINEENSKLYGLCEWNAAAFRNDPTLRLQTSDLAGVKSDFKNIEKIEILKNGELVAEYEMYDSYSAISYQENYFVALENKFTDCLCVTLQKLDLVSQVQQLQEKLGAEKPVGEMNLEEYRQYVLAKIAEQCENDIHAGAEVNGEMFSYKTEDQLNLKALYDAVIMVPEVTGLPYHANGHACRFFSREEIITIYMTLMIRLVSLTTYCNHLNMMISQMETKEELSNVAYGMPLSKEYQEAYDAIINPTMASFEALKAGFLGIEGEEDETTDESGE